MGLQRIVTYLNGQGYVNRQFAKTYVRALVSKIEVGEKQIRISGPKDAIVHQAMSLDASGEFVPAFAQKWRTGEDSNPRPPDS